MIALLGILTAWLTLTAAGFAGLSELRRAGAREAADPVPMPAERPVPSVAGARVLISTALFLR